ncbi:DJ-1/PfpI family protein [Anseongella ginsenosidimutans]|uniref:DJ-1/PfpI family protein n=1 Tax=Anseongella ginsenosidimutans TaxID=496056 RepID=A0A4R3KS17_9SPHI|nr:DJ-1/PfpI family protein [Anseongella ginsenosidimutans]QEC52844.1 DJ-1/PfpI family protein [Anseongella ginsenosidimutans]TCS87229.1 DJ-1/PfpI family protein [Anseongella ginsenosidimutans]
MPNKVRNVAILLFDDCEELDFAGPFGVFNLANDVAGRKLFNVFTLSNHDQIITRHGLRLVTDGPFAYSPEIDILIIPGGRGFKKEMHNDRLMYWLRSTSFRRILTVSTGAFILAQSHLMKGLKTTTHHLFLDELERNYPELEVVRDTRFVDNGKIICSAGSSSGIEGSLHLIEQLYDQAFSEEVAKMMEYRSQGFSSTAF